MISGGCSYLILAMLTSIRRGMSILGENGDGDPNLKPGGGCLHFTWR